MDMDVGIRIAKFIETSSQIIETFDFARSEDIIFIINVYAGHWYGSMLRDLFSEKVGQLYRSWSTCIKLSFNVPRATHTYLVENALAEKFLTVK